MLKCPVCSDIKMREIEKDGVLIDVCPDCKGVWLDRGELDKLMNGMREVRRYYDERYGDSDDDDWEDRRKREAYRNTNYGHTPHTSHTSQSSHHNSDYDYKKKKKKTTVFSLFEDLFD